MMKLLIPLFALLLLASCTTAQTSGSAPPGAAAPSPVLPPAGDELAGYALLAQDLGGNPKAEPRLIAGENWTLTAAEKKSLTAPADQFPTLAYHKTAVQFRYLGLDPDARYRVRVVYLSVNPEQSQKLMADDVELHEPLALTRNMLMTRVCALPLAACEDGDVTVSIVRTGGLNAVISAIELWSDRDRRPWPAGARVRFPGRIPSGMVVVVQDVGGDAAHEPHLAAGGNYALTPDELKALSAPARIFRTLAAHDGAVQFRYLGLDPAAHYQLRVFYLGLGTDRTQQLAADGVELEGPVKLPKGQVVSRVCTLPPATYQDAEVRVTATRMAGPNVVVAAIELWSDREQLLPTGAFIRFRVDALPPGRAELPITGSLKMHQAPWQTARFPLATAKGPGLTPWVNLRSTPGGAAGSLLISLPPGARGATLVSRVASTQGCLREFPWEQLDALRLIVDPELTDVRTFRDQERRYYLNAVASTGEQVFPLTRPPLCFTNAWGWATGGAAEYMVKTFRLVGFNAVATAGDAAKYEQLYGWGSQEGEYAPPYYVPFDEAAAATRYQQFYTNWFAPNGKGHGYAPGLRTFQVSDEPGEIALKPGDPAQVAGFRRWLATQGVKPELFGQTTWDTVPLRLGTGKTAEENRLFYWSRRYQSYLTPKMFALAAEAFRAAAPNHDVRPFVALSGHALYMPSRMSLDMFQLAQYPALTPGISDWMTGGSWWWDSHQSVAYSVAPYNAGARRYGADFGKPPLSYPMMHCVAPTPLRAYTQLANNCKLISYYNYGPDYEVTEGFWSCYPWEANVVQEINNRAAQVDDLLSPGVMRRAHVALLYSMSAEYWYPTNSFGDRRATFLALAHEYYQPDLVTEEQVAAGALAHYQALFVLDYHVAAAAQERIEAWLKEGGLLWACADALLSNEYGEGTRLLERCGLQRSFAAPAPANGTQVRPVPDDPILPAQTVPPYSRPLSVTCPGGRVRAKFADDVPAWVELPVGRGRLVYLGYRVGCAYSQRAQKVYDIARWPADARIPLIAPLREAKITRELYCSAPLVVASPLSTADGTAIVLFSVNTESLAPLTVTLKEPTPPVSVQGFNWTRLVDLPFTYADGTVSVTLAQLPSKQAQIIAVRRRPAPPDDRVAKMRAAAEEHLGAADWQTASAGAWFAGFFPDWGLAPRLAPLLQHQHWAVRRSAAESLGRLKYAAAAPALREALGKETDPHALADELYALVQLGHRDAAALCTKYRADPDSFVRSEAGRAAALLAQQQAKPKKP